MALLLQRPNSMNMKQLRMTRKKKNSDESSSPESILENGIHLYNKWPCYRHRQSRQVPLISINDIFELPRPFSPTAFHTFPAGKATLTRTEAEAENGAKSR